MSNRKIRFIGFTLSPVLYSGGLLSILNIAAGFLGYLYQVLMGRLLEPSDFAIFSAVMAAATAMASPFGALVLGVSRRVSTMLALKESDKLKSFFLAINQKLTLLFLLVSPLFLLLTEPLKHYLKTNNLISILLMGGIVIACAFSSVILAFMQGLKMFGHLGLNGILVAMLKILFSTFFIYIGFGVLGGVIGVFLSYSFLYCVWFYVLKRIFSESYVSQSFSLPIKFSTVKAGLPLLISSSGIVLMTQSDLILVNWFYPPIDAGIYAAAAILGKAIFYLPGGLALAMYPMVSESHASGADTGELFSSVAKFGLGLGLAACIFFLIFGEWIISLFYGSKYEGAGVLLKWYGFAMLPYVYILIAEQYLIAQRRVLYVWVFLLAAPIQILLVLLFHTELWMLFVIVGASGYFVALVGFVITKFFAR